MPDRTKEELRQIYDDLLVVSNYCQRLAQKGMLLPDLLNDKSWEEEKNDFYNDTIYAHRDALRTGKVQACEVQSLCESFIIDAIYKKDKTGFWHHYGMEAIPPSRIELGEYTLETIIEELENILNGNSTLEEERRVNKSIDGFGLSACEPRAFLENAGKEENQNNNLNLPRTKLVDYSHSI